MRIILFFIFYFFTVYNHIAFSQELTIMVKQKTGYGPFKPDGGPVLFTPAVDHPLFQVFDRFEFLNIPNGLTEVKKGMIPFDFLQFLYQSFINTDNFNLFESFKKKNYFKIENEQLSKEPINCLLKVLFAKNQNGASVAILDLNQNGKFNDDPIIILDSIDNFSDLDALPNPPLYTTFETFISQKIVTDSIPLFIFLKDNKLQYSIPTYCEGHQEIQGEKKLLQISHEFRYPNYWLSHLVIDQQMEHVIPKNENFKIANKYFKNLGVDRNTKTLKLIEIDSTKQEFSLDNFAQKDIKSNELIDINNYKGKYLLIDFWGSWCGPCISKMPRQIEAYKQIDKSKIEFIGIAGSDTYELALQVINEKKLPWKNILSDDQNNLTEIFNILKYPTSILINPDGKIVEREIYMPYIMNYLKKYGLVE